MKQVETIYIPVGNDFAYCLVLDNLQPETITDLRAYVSTDGSKGNPYPAYIQDGEIRLDFANTPQGYYNVWVEFVTNGAKVAVNLRNAFVITEWSNVRANFQNYFAGSEYRVNVGAYLQPVNMGITDAPKDGKQYARKDGDWSEVEQGGLTPEQDELLRSTNNATLQHTQSLADIKNSVDDRVYKKLATIGTYHLFQLDEKIDGRYAFAPTDGSYYWIMKDTGEPEVGKWLQQVVGGSVIAEHTLDKYEDAVFSGFSVIEDTRRIFEKSAKIETSLSVIGTIIRVGLTDTDRYYWDGTMVSKFGYENQYALKRIGDGAIIWMAEQEPARFVRVHSYITEGVDGNITATGEGIIGNITDIVTSIERKLDSLSEYIHSKLG